MSVAQAPSRTGPDELIKQTLDPGSFTSWDKPLPELAIEDHYREELAAAASRTGRDESVITGEGTVNGRRVAVVLGEFGFIGGSVGVNAAHRISEAISRATAQGLPLLAAPVSGGTRMQEGTVAFVQMAKVTLAVNAHKAAGLPYLVYLRHPTTGGVFASWGSLGHITVAQPGALIGFLGPKVYHALHGQEFPPGVQRAENLYKHGLIDAVLEPRHLRRYINRVLNVWDSNPATATNIAGGGHDAPLPRDSGNAWTAVTNSRQARRPGLRTLLRHAAKDLVPLSGTGYGEAASAVQVALATIGGTGAVIIGLDRHEQASDEQLGPASLREAQRGMDLAESLRLPLITVVDTPGAALSAEAEEGGLGREIARSLSRLLALNTPTLTVLLGQGAGGGALALFPSDRVISAQHGWLAPLPPEGASAIVYGDTRHAPEMAGKQRISAGDLQSDGIVDEIIDEHPDATAEPEAFALRIGEAIHRRLQEISAFDTQTLLRQRHTRYWNIGTNLTVKDQ